MRPAIAATSVSKRYRLGGDRGPERNFREAIMDGLRAPLRWGKERWSGRAKRERAGDFWALRDVSFEVQPGEVVGIVGGNGAGKSTLLKVLSRITEQTSGRVELRGRVGSLLEVGTGFHQELSGRENIFLNGAILGMSRSDIQRKFDAIVSFAEVERFLDTPVKHYSSGMYVRLAFAVASHLEPDILIIDEVLAVGDAAFQRKCLGRMGEVSRDGRTILFVSHNMTAVKSLCSRAIALDRGRIVSQGDVDQVVNTYLARSSEFRGGGRISHDHDRMTNGAARFVSVEVLDDHGSPVSQLFFGQPFRVRCACEVFKEVPDGHFEVSVAAEGSSQITYATTIDGGAEPMRLPKGRYQVEVRFENTLLPRDYTLHLGLHHHHGTTLDYVRDCASFVVLKAAETGNDHYRWNVVRGYVRMRGDWQVRPEPGE